MFRLDSRRIHPAWRPGHARRSARSLFLRTVVLAVGIWILFLISGQPRPFQETSGNIVAIQFLISVGANIILDFACLIVAAGSINSEIVAGRWDLLRLTLLRPEHIAAVKHAVAQTRSWRFMIFIVALRVTVISLAVATQMGIWIQNGDSIRIGETPGEGVLALTMLALFAVIYAVEPLGRVKAVTALGVALSAYFRQPLSLILAIVGAVLMLVLSQAIIMTGIIWLWVRLLVGTYTAETGYTLTIVFFLLTGLVIFVYYRLLVRLSLRQTARRISRD